MRAILKWTFLVAVVLLACVYAYDYISVRHRMGAQKPGDPFDTVVYPRVLAIPQKGNRVEYALDAQSPMETDACVHSLFPHFGYTPCWYVNRKAENPIPMVILISLRNSLPGKSEPGRGAIVRHDGRASS
jgi:hypothetical protein